MKQLLSILGYMLCGAIIIFGTVGLVIEITGKLDAVGITIGLCLIGLGAVIATLIHKVENKNTV